MHDGVQEQTGLTLGVIIIRLAFVIPLGVALAFAGEFCLVLPFDWPITLTLGLLFYSPVVWMFWRTLDARRQVTRLAKHPCPQCGFDRRAGLGERCPECGWKP